MKKYCSHFTFILLILGMGTMAMAAQTTPPRKSSNGIMAKETRLPEPAAKSLPTQPVPNNNVARPAAAKTLETDSKGRIIHTGPRGGKYYINKNGNKTYVKRK